MSLSSEKTEKEEKEVFSTSRAGAKRKKDVTNNQTSKVMKFEGNVSGSRCDSSEDLEKNAVEDVKMLKLEAELEGQTKELWALKDDLKKHVSTAEMREMLEANGLDSSGSELDLRDRW